MGNFLYETYDVDIVIFFQLHEKIFSLKITIKRQ